MQYFGGKQRIAKQLSAVINPLTAHRETYVEPFVGGASLMASVVADVRIGNDANAALISLWRALAAGWAPPNTLTEDEYARLKTAADPTDPLTAFAAFGCSFAGKWFGGYARGGEGRNYAANAVSSIRVKQTSLGGVRWSAGDYRECFLPAYSVIYCDPPYAGTTQYGAVAPFDWLLFWDWCREKDRQGHSVLVSEYNAPPDFSPLLSVGTRTDMRNKEGKQEARIERLFVPARRLASLSTV